MGTVKTTHKKAVKTQQLKKGLKRFAQNPTKKYMITRLAEGLILLEKDPENPKRIYGTWLRPDQIVSEI